MSPVPPMTTIFMTSPFVELPIRRGREMIELLAVEEPKPKPAKIRAVSHEATIDQLFKRMLVGHAARQR
jgi:hypothetical protein